jgi:hypothetical protein
MTFRRIQISAIAVVLFTLFLSAGVAQPTSRDVAVRNATSTTVAADWVFEGCWTQFPAGPCRDVFHDSQGNYLICRACGTTGNPTPGKCSPISQATLASGFWCS